MAEEYDELFVIIDGKKRVVESLAVQAGFAQSVGFRFKTEKSYEFGNYLRVGSLLTGISHPQVSWFQMRLDDGIAHYVSFPSVQQRDAWLAVHKTALKGMPDGWMFRTIRRDAAGRDWFLYTTDDQHPHKEFHRFPMTAYWVDRQVYRSVFLLVPNEEDFAQAAAFREHVAADPIATASAVKSAVAVPTEVYDLLKDLMEADDLPEHLAARTRGIFAQLARA